MPTVFHTQVDDAFRPVRHCTYIIGADKTELKVSAEDGLPSSRSPTPGDEDEDDPWSLPQLKDTRPQWSGG